MIYFNKMSNVRRFCWIFPPCCEGNKDQCLSNELQLDLKDRKKERKWRKPPPPISMFVCVLTITSVQSNQDQGV